MLFFLSKLARCVWDNNDGSTLDQCGLITSLSMRCSAEEPMMDLVNFFSIPSSTVKIALTVARLATWNNFITHHFGQKVFLGNSLV
jgi:hypothetical protein